MPSYCKKCGRVVPEEEVFVTEGGTKRHKTGLASCRGIIVQEGRARAEQKKSKMEKMMGKLIGKS